MWVPSIDNKQLVNLDLCDTARVDCHSGYYYVMVHIHARDGSIEIYQGSEQDCKEYLQKLLKMIGTE